MKERCQEKHSKECHSESANVVKLSRSSEIRGRAAISLGIVESVCSTDLLNELSCDQRGAQLQAVYYGEPHCNEKSDELTGHGIEKQGLQPFRLDSRKHGLEERQIVKHAVFYSVCSDSDLLCLTLAKHLDELLVSLDGFVFDRDLGS